MPHIWVPQRNYRLHAYFDNCITTKLEPQILLLLAISPSDFKASNGLELMWDSELPKTPYLSQCMLNQRTGIGLTGGPSTIAVQSALVHWVYCTHEKPPSTFWIEIGTLTNREGIWKSTVISPGAHYHLFEQLPNVGLQAFKEEIILSTTWKQSLISHEMKAPLIYTCNATVSYSCWCEKKWSLILDLIFMWKFCSSLSYTCPACMTRQHLLKPSTSSEATLNKQQRAQHWRKIVLTNMCDHKTQFSCRSAGGKTQNKISTVRFLIAASFLKKMIAYQVVRYLYSLNILEMTYCNKHHIK